MATMTTLSLHLRSHHSGFRFTITNTRLGLLLSQIETKNLGFQCRLGKTRIWFQILERNRDWEHRQKRELQSFILWPFQWFEEL